MLVDPTGNVTITNDGATILKDTEYSCLSCMQDQFSSFPVTHNDSSRYSYSKNRGLELTFRIKNK